ncbi:hypothetical protein [Paractinoplanes rishiriensis]|uniref:hypothetical protein n=1 Tax=Paractinoplanes rishiriensis TaxID=1050105 RepID=UPI00194100F8|nr:hypothetical protein [Actinoplanes rishiriensis]
MALSLIAGCTALIGLRADLGSLLPERPCWMFRPEVRLAAPYNIVVADPAVEWPETDNVDAARARELTRTIVDTLERQIVASVEDQALVEVGGPCRSGVTDLNDDRAAALERVRKTHNGDIAVSLVLRPQRFHTKVNLEFSIGGDRHGEAAELAGYARFGDVDIGDLAGAGPTHALLTSTAEQLETYVRLLRAVYQYSAQQYVTATKTWTQRIPARDSASPRSLTSGVRPDAQSPSRPIGGHWRTRTTCTDQSPTTEARRMRLMPMPGPVPAWAGWKPAACCPATSSGLPQAVTHLRFVTDRCSPPPVAPSPAERSGSVVHARLPPCRAPGRGRRQSYVWDLDHRVGQQSAVETAIATNQIRSALVQGLGTVAIVAGAYVGWRQLQHNMRVTQAHLCSRPRARTDARRVLDDVDLAGAYANRRTWWPAGFDPEAHGRVVGDLPG